MNGASPGAAQASAPAVEVEGLCRRYGRFWALVDVSLRVPAGQALLVVGHNGSGKSTLFRVLGGALSPDRGTVRILGHDARTARHDLRDATALLSHHACTYEGLSALQNLEVVADLLGQPRRRADLLPRLEEVGLAARADDAVATFSAGMRKRLSFARLLLQRPKVVLLDEPDAALDVQGFAYVESLVARLRAQGATVLIASHLIERGAAICERAIVLERGRLVWDGKASELPLQRLLGGGGTAA